MCTVHPGVRRTLQQATVVGATTVGAPSGTQTLYNLHGVGTQNYTASKFLRIVLLKHGCHQFPGRACLEQSGQLCKHSVKLTVKVWVPVQNGSYQNTGAVADLYDGTTKTARHFFDASGTPTWQILDPNTGAIQGMVHGAVKAKAARQREQNDGGFGSVDALLLTASGGSGMYNQPILVHCHLPLNTLDLVTLLIKHAVYLIG